MILEGLELRSIAEKDGWDLVRDYVWMFYLFEREGCRVGHIKEYVQNQEELVEVSKVLKFNPH